MTKKTITITVQQAAKKYPNVAVTAFEKHAAKFGIKLNHVIKNTKTNGNTTNN